MAKYYVTFSCGHEARVELFGKGTDRERKIAWYEREGLCPECYKAAKRAESKKANEGLPELKGSEKQIAWAERIRAERLAELKSRAKWGQDRLDGVSKALEDKRFTDMISTQYGGDIEAARADIPNKMPKEAKAVKEYEGAQAITDAKWWIEHR